LRKAGDRWSFRHRAWPGVWATPPASRSSRRPADASERYRAFPDPSERINPGDSLVVAPWDKIAASPLSRESGILCGDVDIARSGTARRSLDVAGHYARPDVFELSVNRRPRDPIAFD
jgi:nitrilase